MTYKMKRKEMQGIIEDLVRMCRRHEDAIREMQVSPTRHVGAADAPTRDSIDWSHVSDKYNYMARDEDNLTCLFEDKPLLFSTHFLSDGLHEADARPFASYKRGTCDWQDSLVVRPGYEEES